MKIAILTTDNREPFRQYDRPNPWFGTAPEALLQGFALLPDLEVHVVSCTQRPMISSPEKLSANIWFHSLHVPKIGWMRTLYQGCVRATRKKLREIQPDVVHGQGTERECSLGAIFSGRPNVVTIHGNMAELARLFRAPVGSYHWLAARLENFALRRTAGVFCNSLYTESLVRPRAKKIWPVPNALRREFFEPAPEISTAPRNPVLLNVGAICERKRQLELLAVAEKLHRQNVKLEWHFIGRLDPTLPYAAEFHRRMQPMAAAGRVRHTDAMNTKELIRHFDSAGALVHFPAEEAFGLVVAEALARGLNFFGARIGGVADIAENVPGTVLVEGNNFDGLAAELTRWMVQGRPRADGAARLMCDRYHPSVIARRHLEIYREVLGRS
jgi:glycosyltransferase involved in cell wall biosynthesis